MLILDNGRFLRNVNFFWLFVIIVFFNEINFFVNKKKFVIVDFNLVLFLGFNFDSVCKVSCKNNIYDRLNVLKFIKGN